MLIGKYTKVHSGLHHYVPLVETIRKYIWITSFGVQTKRLVNMKELKIQHEQYEGPQLSCHDDLVVVGFP
jgi:hypothetical protein